MKKVLINILIATLFVANTTIAQAATTDGTNVTSTATSSGTTSAGSVGSNADTNTIKISLANIKDIIIENNQQAKIYDNTKKNAQLVYDDAKDTEQGFETNVSDTQNKINNFQLNADGSNASDLTNLKSDLTKYQDQLDSAKNTLDSDRYTLKTANIKYEQNLETLIKQAQTDYISYVLNDLSNKDYSTANVQLLKKAADAAKIQLDMGFLSKNDYTTAQLNYTNALNAANTSNDAEENDKAKLLNDLGISEGQNVVFDTNLDHDLQDVSKIVYDTDLKQMLDNNLTLQTDNISIDKASDAKDAETDGNDNLNEETDNNYDNAQMQLELDKNNAEKDFKIKYDALMNSYATMKSSANSLQQQKDNYNAAEISYDYGFASQQSVDESKVNSLKTSQNYQKDEATFYENYLSYLEMKEGY